MATNNTRQHRREPVGPRVNVKIRERDYQAAVACPLPVTIVDLMTGWRLAFDRLPQSEQVALLMQATRADAAVNVA